MNVQTYIVQSFCLQRKYALESKLFSEGWCYTFSDEIRHSAACITKYICPLEKFRTYVVRFFIIIGKLPFTAFN